MLSLLLVFCAYFLVWCLLLLISWGQLFCFHGFNLNVYTGSFLFQVQYLSLILKGITLAVCKPLYHVLILMGSFLWWQIKQVLSRMFPFGRGLCHAYWAPNFWVFYIILDKALSFLLRKLGFDIKAPSASFTSGLVGDSSPFSVMPQVSIFFLPSLFTHYLHMLMTSWTYLQQQVTPIVTFLLVLLSMSPCLYQAWKEPRPSHVTRWVAYTYTCGFLFGWHVHEKASLHFVIPLAIVATYSLEDARHYFLLSIGTRFNYSNLQFYVNFLHETFIMLLEAFKYMKML